MLRCAHIFTSMMFEYINIFISFVVHLTLSAGLRPPSTHWSATTTPTTTKNLIYVNIFFDIKNYKKNCM